MRNLAGSRNSILATAAALLLSACGSAVNVQVSASAAPGAPVGSPPAGGPTTGSGAATLTWLPPTRNTDGSPLVDLAGYRVYHGGTATSLSQVMRVDSPGITTVVVDGLSTGTHYFAVSAVNRSGVEGALSSVRNKQIP
jgi:hypothetical protein